MTVRLRERVRPCEVCTARKIAIPSEAGGVKAAPSLPSTSRSKQDDVSKPRNYICSVCERASNEYGYMK